MLRIALCDDEAQGRESVRSLIEQWAANSGIAVQTLSFDNGDALLEAFRTCKLDVLFLDIMMPLLSGMDTAREVRELDKTVKIVFLTATPEFALESYSVKASGYLLKPVQPPQICEVLGDITAALREEPKHLLMKSAAGYHKIFLHTIEYVEAQNKRVVFCLKDGDSLSFAEPLAGLESRLPVQDGFFRCHRSYIVSMPHAVSFTANEILMKSGAKVPIARGMGKAFQDAYFAFLFND